VIYFFLAVFFAPALALVDFLAAFLAMSRDSCHLGFRCHFPFSREKKIGHAPLRHPTRETTAQKHTQVINNSFTSRIDELRDKSKRAYIEI